LDRSGRRVTRSPAQAFSAEVGSEHVVVLRGQGGEERPDASWTKNSSGFAAHGRPTLAVLAQLGFLARRRQCLREVAWPQYVERNEGEECSARACREPLRVRSSRACQRGSVITSDRQHVRLGNRFPKGELGSRSGSIDQRRVPGPTAVGSAAGPGRKLPAQENVAAVKQRRREARAFAASMVVNGFPEIDTGPPLTLAGRDVQNSAPGRTGQDQSGRWFFRR